MPLLNVITTRMTEGLDQVRNQILQSINRTNEILQYFENIENNGGIAAMVVNDELADLVNTNGWGVNLVRILALTSRVHHAKDYLNEALTDVMRSCKHLSLHSFINF